MHAKRHSRGLSLDPSLSLSSGNRRQGQMCANANMLCMQVEACFGATLVIIKKLLILMFSFSVRSTGSSNFLCFLLEVEISQETVTSWIRPVLGRWRYFGVSDDDSDRLMRAGLMGGQLEEVVPNVHVGGVVVDPFNGHVYWTAARN